VRRELIGLLVREVERGVATGLRVGAAVADVALERAEQAGADVSLLKRLLKGEQSPDWEATEAGPPLDGLYEGLVHVEVGPLDKFSQLVDLEDAANEIGSAGEIKVERFHNNRATLTLDLTQPTDLIQELEHHAPFPITIRHTAADRVVLDVEAATEKHQ
jgi:hypothetical protein